MHFRPTRLTLACASAAALALAVGGCCCSLPAGVGGYTPQPSPFIVNATDDNFDEVVMASDKPVVVDFWASWCGPCADIDPTVVKLAEEFQDRIKFVRVNYDDSPITRGEFVEQGIPTLAFFASGEFVESRVGAQPENSLRAWLLDQLAALDEEA